MAVVYNIKGTSESEFQIGKSGPKLVKSSNDLEIQTPGGALNVGNLDVDGNITKLDGYYIASSATNITSSGTDQASAEPILKELNVVATVGSGTGVIFPSSIIGMRITIVNTGANSLLVYPATGGAINALATNAGYSLASGQSTDFIAISSTQWMTLS